MTEDFLERMRMADQDDDDAELKRLKQLRQVWLAMPDEEPPTRGLDALMAAAREKAVEMQPAPEPWWKRMFAAMVRPPALALATIIVVAGGAVLVNRHQDQLDATSTAPAPAAAESAGSAAPVAGAPIAPGAAPRAESSGNGIGAMDQTPQADTAARSVDLVAPAVPAAKPRAQITHEAVVKKSAPPRPAKTAGKIDADDELGDTLALPKHIVVTKHEGKGDAEAPRAPEPPEVEPNAPTAPVTTKTSPPPERRAPAPSPASGSAAAARPVEEPAKSPAPPKPAPPATRGPVKGGAAQLATDNDVQNQPESVESMLRRAREAATRGDCATAKAIAAAIAKQDGAFYRATAAKDPIVAKCL